MPVNGAPKASACEALRGETPRTLFVEGALSPNGSLRRCSKEDEVMPVNGAPKASACEALRGETPRTLFVEGALSRNGSLRRCSKEDGRVMKTRRNSLQSFEAPAKRAHSMFFPEPTPNLTLHLSAGFYTHVFGFKHVVNNIAWLSLAHPLLILVSVGMLPTDTFSRQGGGHADESDDRQHYPFPPASPRRCSSFPWAPRAASGTTGAARRGGKTVVVLLLAVSFPAGRETRRRPIAVRRSRAERGSPRSIWKGHPVGRRRKRALSDMLRSERASTSNGTRR